jgi:hypothetical protein
MFKWVDKKIMPVLLQVHKVLAVAETSVQYVLEVLGQLGVSTDKPVWDSVRTISNALSTAKTAIEKAIDFLGGTIPSVSSLAGADLNEEVAKLKRML